MREHALVSRILAAYGLGGSDVLEPQSGYRNRSYAVTLASGERANLIMYKSEPGMLREIRDANRVSNFLAARGFPARQTLDPRIMSLVAPGRTKYAALYNYLPGATIPWEAYTMGHIKLLGATMARLHAALRELPQAATLPPVAAEYLAVAGRMQRYFSDPAVATAIDQKLGIIPNFSLIDRHRRLLQACADLSNQQALHMDLVRGNVLFDETDPPVVTGIIDFEKTGVGHPAFDIARTLAFLLVDCKYTPGSKVRKYFLYSGYLKRGKGTIPQLSLLEALTNFFLLHDFYKFLRHNPYESLHRNEHYTRTRDLLLARGVIRFATKQPLPV